MTLTPLESWVVLVVLFASVIGFLYAASRPSWTHRRRHRLHDQQLDELARYERARARLAHLQNQNPGHVRLGHPHPRKDDND